MGHLCKKPIQLNQETARSLCEPRRPAWVMDSRARPEHESQDSNWRAICSQYFEHACWADWRFTGLRVRMSNIEPLRQSTGEPCSPLLSAKHRGQPIANNLNPNEARP
jgi:hypothetical protein